MTTSSSPQLSFSTRYLLDANIFIAAWRDHYPIDLYPGFWECLQRFGQEKILLSVDRVRDEINSPDELVAWLKRHWRDAFALTTEPHTASVFSEMQVWVQTNDQFLPAAKHEFASAADGWLAAYGDAPFTIDLDSTICETYGLAKEGARHHGYTGKRGYHPLLAIAAGTGDVLMSRLREGRANTARGAAHFLRETVGRVRYAGANGRLTLRADSGFYTHGVVSVCRKMDVRFSITIREGPWHRSGH